MRYDDAIDEFEGEDIHGKSRLIYAYFGLAVYYAQCLEQTFINMIWLNRIFKKKVKSQKELESIIDAVENSKKTMGNLINEVKTEYSVPDDLQLELRDILNKRNYLTHKFFKDQIWKFKSDIGMREMLKYFCDFIDSSKAVDEQMKDLHSHYTKKAGLTDERIAELEKEMEREELERVKQKSNRVSN